MADWKRALLKSLGAPPTPENMAFLTNWQRREGGHTHNSARFNWLNTTHGPGSRINSVGVKRFGNFKTGIRSTAETLTNGRYNDIVAGLRSGNPYAAPVQDDLSVWVSGSPTKGLSYASKVLGSAGGWVPTPSKAGRGPLGNPGLPASQPDFRQMMAGYLFDSASRRAAGEQPNFGGLMQLAQARKAMIAASNNFGPVADPHAGHDHEGPVYRGKILQPSANWSGTHITDGLDWNNGARTAIDIMARPGTPVGAPASGTIVRHGSAQGGQALYLDDDDPDTDPDYWLGHIAKMLAVGTRVRKGQPIAVISKDHPRPHLHIDRKR